MDHWYICFGLLVMSPLGFNTRLGSLICTWWRHTCYMFPEIYLWHNTCWPLGSQLGSQAIHFHILASRHWWGSKLGPSMLQKNALPTKLWCLWKFKGLIFYVNTDSYANIYESNYHSGSFSGWFCFQEQVNNFVFGIKSLASDSNIPDRFSSAKGKKWGWQTHIYHLPCCSFLLVNMSVSILWTKCLFERYTTFAHKFFSLNFVNDGQSVKFVIQM